MPPLREPPPMPAGPDNPLLQRRLVLLPRTGCTATIAGSRACRARFNRPARPNRPAGHESVLLPEGALTSSLVDDKMPLRPRVVAVVAAGRLAHLTEAGRLRNSSPIPRKAVAAA
jgi:hypothetical protein